MLNLAGCATSVEEKGRFDPNRLIGIEIKPVENATRTLRVSLTG